ncbi:SWIM zinc finger family protein (plasmid) [Bradyrhizobium japonicum]|uniref:SWIM zinc finger family protein n=2 Tax=Bradyrhizobium japonicum TaxID=375 RepID=UPI002714CB63|nr:SWIM zinc finger family protein [Bradyrhizobium japonicum]MEB2679483.1 SWIM zinc finger family protein [Bradyrhizobium japonicum]WLB34025.1 SWIM zinc finger family protein [Bradyrhizobium japonicum]WRI85327.1 SWIM zinc finger family protein [Bradyrhizobium japonicum]WRJ79403.1 SWIM zinc finger family protein [Bradyrhizobium japonicum]WRJ97720.1 SWIM zinc finger family protein [Bradyrhizobium japonicum]
MSYYGWHAYVPVAEKRRQAERKLAKLKKQGRSVAPVRIEGRTITKSFWGRSWCVNLERYSDYENRLPRGRTYVRNGSVIDLQIAKGEISAMVAGSELYQIKIVIAPVTRARWKSICRDCAGTVDSLVELLQGRLAKGVMDRVCREGDGLFPSPTEIKLSCSCPDWADMCKHVAAALYGVGARLDEKPQLLFVLRDVDETEMLASAGQGSPLTTAPGAAKVLDESDVAALFGLEMAETPDNPKSCLHSPKATPTLQAAKRQDICRKDQASSEDRCRLTSCDSGQFGNEKDNPSKCGETAHSAATIVFQ